MRAKIHQKVPLVEDLQEAAQEQEHNFVIDSDDHAEEQIEDQPQPTESAPVENEEKPVQAAPETDNFQTRINKVTADKYAEKRRADELQKKLDAYNNAPKEEAKKPTLEAHDYDEEAFNSANVSYQVQQELAKQRAEQESITRQANEQREVDEFNGRIAKLGKEDFNDKANAIPNLPEGVANALMSAENGAELIYHLGGHLDVADAISKMTPASAMMELGRISATMSVKKEPKISAAPEPIKTLKSGSSISGERGPVGATYS